MREGIRVLDIEARAVQDLKARLDDRFAQAVNFLFACQGKVVISGMGKSGLIGQKIAATLASTGTPS
ncbi:MAG: D-arabinose 5-phosphate isomerase, partial [Nitrospira sp.]|nr:D-arabinose 5-phosphate isomerase [Nitrospira sp.]